MQEITELERTGYTPLETIKKVIGDPRLFRKYQEEKISMPKETLQKLVDQAEILETTEDYDKQKKALAFFSKGKNAHPDFLLNTFIHLLKKEATLAKMYQSPSDNVHSVLKLIHKNILINKKTSPLLIGLVNRILRRLYYTLNQNKEILAKLCFSILKEHDPEKIRDHIFDNESRTIQREALEIYATKMGAEALPTLLEVMELQDGNLAPTAFKFIKKQTTRSKTDLLAKIHKVIKEKYSTSEPMKIEYMYLLERLKTKEAYENLIDLMTFKQQEVLSLKIVEILIKANKYDERVIDFVTGEIADNPKDKYELNALFQCLLVMLTRKPKLTSLRTLSRVIPYAWNTSVATEIKALINKLITTEK